MSVSLACFAGLDYHQDTIQVCVMDGDGKVIRNCACVNDWREVQRTVGARGRRVRVAIEACCGAARTDSGAAAVGAFSWSVGGRAAAGETADPRAAA